jgi:hypothetical protein
MHCTTTSTAHVSSQQYLQYTAYQPQQLLVRMRIASTDRRCMSGNICTGQARKQFELHWAEICAVPVEWREAELQAAWYHPDLSEPVTKGRNNWIKMRDREGIPNIAVDELRECCVWKTSKSSTVNPAYLFIVTRTARVLTKSLEYVSHIGVFCVRSTTENRE